MADPNSAPAQLRRMPGEPAYQLRADLHAVHGPAGPGGGGPVYALSGGSLAVPTGRVFVRFADGADPQAASDALRGAGFRIEQVPSYAPNAAWLTPLETDIGDALGKIGAIQSVPGVEHAEPELLMERHSRG